MQNELWRRKDGEHLIAQQSLIRIDSSPLKPHWWECGCNSSSSPQGGCPQLAGQPRRQGRSVVLPSWLSRSLPREPSTSGDTWKPLADLWIWDFMHRAWGLESSHALEPWTPCLSAEWLQAVISLPPGLCFVLCKLGFLASYLQDDFED